MTVKKQWVQRKRQVVLHVDDEETDGKKDSAESSITPLKQLLIKTKALRQKTDSSVPLGPLSPVRKQHQGKSSAKTLANLSPGNGSRSVRSHVHSSTPPSSSFVVVSETDNFDQVFMQPHGNSNSSCGDFEPLKENRNANFEWVRGSTRPCGDNGAASRRILDIGIGESKGNRSVSFFSEEDDVESVIEEGMNTKAESTNSRGALSGEVFESIDCNNNFEFPELYYLDEKVDNLRRLSAQLKQDLADLSDVSEDEEGPADRKESAELSNLKLSSCSPVVEAKREEIAQEAETSTPQEDPKASRLNRLIKEIVSKMNLNGDRDSYFSSPKERNTAVNREDSNRVVIRNSHTNEKKSSRLMNPKPSTGGECEKKERMHPVHPTEMRNSDELIKKQEEIIARLQAAYANELDRTSALEKENETLRHTVPVKDRKDIRDANTIAKESERYFSKCAKKEKNANGEEEMLEKEIENLSLELSEKYCLGSNEYAKSQAGTVADAEMKEESLQDAEFGIGEDAYNLDQLSSDEKQDSVFNSAMGKRLQGKIVNLISSKEIHYLELSQLRCLLKGELGFIEKEHSNIAHLVDTFLRSMDKKLPDSCIQKLKREKARMKFQQQENSSDEDKALFSSFHSHIEGLCSLYKTLIAVLSETQKPPS
eukprot:Nk52_evm50s1360 gene=Nk52_evmTU50s1360